MTQPVATLEHLCFLRDDRTEKCHLSIQVGIWKTGKRLRFIAVSR